MARLSAALILTLISSASVFSNNLGLKEQLEILKRKVDQLIAENSMKTQGVTTKTANPRVDGNNWMIEFDAIAWHLTVEDTEYAYRVNVPPIAPLQYIHGETQKITFGWDFAFRLGVGKNFCHDQWDARLVFTHFRTEDDGVADGNVVNGVVPLKGGAFQDEAVFAEYGKSIFAFDYNDLFLEMGRNYFISSRLALRPTVSVRSTWVSESQITRFNGGPTLLTNTWHINDSEKFWGIGPRVGIASNWYVFKKISVYGLLNFSFLYSYFNVNHRENVSDQAVDFLVIRDKTHQFTPAAQFACGLGWGKYLNHDKQYLELKFGYDGEYFWGLNQMLHIYMVNPTVRYNNFDGNVSMHGVSLKATLNF